MRYKVLLFLSGILVGLGVFESLGGYFAIANHATKTGMPAYFGLINGWFFYLLALLVLGVRYAWMKKAEKNKVLSKKP